MSGFVNITFDRQSNSRPTTIIGKVQKVTHVDFAHLVTGAVDAIAFVNAPDLTAFGNAILAINRVPGVLSTNTNVAIS